LKVHHILFMLWVIVFLLWMVKQFREANKRAGRD
jgi:hypothetical protein